LGNRKILARSSATSYSRVPTPDIVRIYLQAESNFRIEGNEEAAGTMYRKALDIQEN
jgi:hypothetical protein